MYALPGIVLKISKRSGCARLQRKRALAVVSAVLNGGAKGSKCAADSARYSIWLHHGAKTPHDFLQAPGDLA